MSLSPEISSCAYEGLLRSKPVLCVCVCVYTAVFQEETYFTSHCEISAGSQARKPCPTPRRERRAGLPPMSPSSREGLGSVIPLQLRAWFQPGTLSLARVTLGSLLLVYPTWKTTVIIALSPFGLLWKVNLSQWKSLSTVPSLPPVRANGLSHVHIFGERGQFLESKDRYCFG